MEEKGDAFNHRLARQSSNTDLGMPLWALSLTIFSLPCYALALLQSSRITGAFVRAQQPSSGTGENGAFQQQNQHWETASIPPPPPLILFPRPWGLMHIPAKAAKPLRGGLCVGSCMAPADTRAPLHCSHMDAARAKAACPAAHHSFSRAGGLTLFPILYVVVEGRLQIP